MQGRDFSSRTWRGMPVLASKEGAATTMLGSVASSLVMKALSS